MVANGGEHRDVREEVLHHLYGLPDDVEIGFSGGAPQVVRDEVARPDYEVYVLGVIRHIIIKT